MKNRVANLWVVLAILILIGTFWKGLDSEAGNLLAFMCIIYYGENILNRLNKSREENIEDNND